MMHTKNNGGLLGPITQTRWHVLVIWYELLGLLLLTGVLEGRLRSEWSAIAQS